MDFQVLVTQLQTGGPWALLALSLLALGWVARAYVQTRDKQDAYRDQLINQMKEILIESTAASVQQAQSNDRVARALEALRADVLRAMERLRHVR